MKQIRIAPGRTYDLEDYWQRVEALRTDAGLPPWAFDFIGVHRMDITRAWSFSAPICLCEQPPSCARPEWEDDHYDTRQNAIAAARKLGKMYGVHVVVCDADWRVAA